MADINTYMTNTNLAFICIALAFLLLLIWYLRRSRGNSCLPVPLELYDIGITQSPARSLMEEFNSRLSAFKEKDQQVRVRLKTLEELELENLSPVEVLDGASQDEQTNILYIFPEVAVDGCSNKAIVNALRKAGSHSVATGIRLLGSGDKYVQYIEVVKDVARKVGAKITDKMTMHELEKIVIMKVFETILKNCSPEDKDALLKGAESQHEKTYVGPAVATGALVVANLSGFGLYLASTASTIALASAFGIAVPAYAGVISVLSVATGPVGWGALAILFAYKLGGPDFKKTVPGVMMIASIRARHIAERDAEIERLMISLSGELATEQSNLEMLRAQIYELTAKFSNRKSQ